MLLQDRVAVITGAGRGIGEATALRFAREGAKVVVCDLNGENVDRVVKSIKDKGGTASGMVADVASNSEIKGMIEKVVQQFGTVDILINNAGIARDALAHNLSEQDWDMVINVNLKGTFNCCQAVIPTMREKGYGKIVNISSVSRFGNMGQVCYSASKEGVVGLTRTLAKELAAKNITVNAVAPGSILTEMLMAVPPKIRELVTSVTPMRREGAVEEIASACLFLGSDESSYVTGQVLHVDGGMFMP